MEHNINGSTQKVALVTGASGSIVDVSGGR